MNIFFNAKSSPCLVKGASVPVLWGLIALAWTLAPPKAQAQELAAERVQQVQLRSAANSVQMSNVTVQCTSGQYIGGLGSDGSAIITLAPLRTPCLVKVHGGETKGALFALLDERQPLLIVDAQSTAHARERLGQADLENYFDDVEQLVPHLDNLPQSKKRR